MDNKLTETGSSNRRVAAVPIWVKPYLTIEEGRIHRNRKGKNPPNHFTRELSFHGK